MSEQTLQRELLDQIDKLPPYQQRRVLEFARSLAKPEGKSGAELLRFGGAIDPVDLDAMASAIEEGCEHVNSDEW
jgi:hypothetical protein